MKSKNQKEKQKKENHCFSVYFHKDQRWKIKLAKILSRKTGRSVGNIMASLLDLALVDNGLMDKKGNSLVKGVGPKVAPPKKKKILRTTSSTLKALE